MPGPVPQRRAAVMAGFCALVTLAVLAVDFRGPAPLAAPLAAAENYVQDFFARTGRLTPANTNLVIIGIDQPVYGSSAFSAADLKGEPVLRDLQGNFPWSRAVWARLVEKLVDAHAKAVAIDLVFAAKAEGDEELRAALDADSNRVVIGGVFNAGETDRGVPRQFTAPCGDLIPDTPGHPAALDPRVGFVNIWPDGDGVFRSARFRVTNHELGDVLDAPPGAVVESFTARALEKFGAAERIPAVGAHPIIRFSGPPGTWPVISVGDVLTPEIWDKNFGDGKFFAGKLALIGPTAILFQDLHQTPFRGAMSGPEIHLQIINAALHGEFLHETPPAASGAIVALAGIFAAALCQWMRAPVKRLLVILGSGVTLCLAAKFLFNHANLITPVVSPLVVLVVTGVGALGYDFIAERLERMKLRHTMGLYFSPRVLDAVLADPGSMRPRRAEVQLLLTDLRNSTPLAERLGPQGMFDLLNRVFEAQTGAIMSEDGNLEHFLGDQFLSYWGAPQQQPDAADRAERAAMKLIRAMEDLRGGLPAEIQEWFGYGVALHSGSVLVGNKGSALRLDYGLVGDAVNEAARVESLTKFYGVRLLVTGETFGQFSRQAEHRLVDRVIVKGKTEPVELFERQNPSSPPNYAALCARYKAVYDEYAAGKFAAGRMEFEKVAEEFSDGPSEILASRCAGLSAKPPANWNGIWKMEAK
ncbi:MAG: adenylate/guanylate cyclase domain-containing protein [Verrucomicrobia bacterium]|nr:adenylate/guanylate cyclase domain-containing protein [Verrucomicrobiota bacterium]